jgi:hypothetical protein
MLSNRKWDDFRLGYFVAMEVNAMLLIRGSPRAAIGLLL